VAESSPRDAVVALAQEVRIAFVQKRVIDGGAFSIKPDAVAARGTD
jgi:hypothetical protein